MNEIVNYVDYICQNYNINAYFIGKAKFGPYKGEIWLFENGFIKIKITFIDFEGKMLIFSQYKKPFIDKRFEIFKNSN